MTIIDIIPKGYTFDNNVLTIPNVNPMINDLSYIYGIYTITSSSSDSSKNNLPYNVFNKTPDKQIITNSLLSRIQNQRHM